MRKRDGSFASSMASGFKLVLGIWFAFNILLPIILVIAAIQAASPILNWILNNVPWLIANLILLLVENAIVDGILYGIWYLLACHGKTDGNGNPTRVMRVILRVYTIMAIVFAILTLLWTIKWDFLAVFAQRGWIHWSWVTC